MSNFDRSKLSSGKFWLTLISGIVFAYTATHKILDSQAVSAILTAVFTSYFMKDNKNDSQLPK